MAKTTKKVSDSVMYAVLYILIGIMFIVFQRSMLNWLLTIAGIVFIALGIYDIIKKNMTNGIIEAVIGIVIILGGWLFVEIVLIVFGALLAVKGISDLIAAFQGTRNVMNIIVAILTLVVGILLIVSKWVMVDWFFIVVGVVFIVEGGLSLLGK